MAVVNVKAARACGDQMIASLDATGVVELLNAAKEARGGNFRPLAFWMGYARLKSGKPRIRIRAGREEA